VRPGPLLANTEVDLLVDSVYVGRLQEFGARTVQQPFDISIGRCAVVVDPFANSLSS
jgi:hypothetical protein